ncbi:putative trans-acting regulator [Carnobacterium sp. 17-4]|uniref:helix-turn-helix domain-containing protein n=1 Tax=Carnobacterium sp. (strain 17-4) TaxID=208596 RepID=UPI0002058ED6|nr:helix-turn-helix domain-containing protein [Carnobacterium sp. 17-4]AEB30250.1 putative trans-acting regulator [Carnobacterium sp. 17-4]
MRLLIDSSSLRRLELIELLNASDEWWTVEELAFCLNCSVRSVKADIYYYNISAHLPIKLITSNHHGVKLIVLTTFQMESVYQEILARNLNIQLLECLYNETNYSIEDYAERLFTSTSSIIRSIKQINLFLDQYKLSVQKNSMTIVGSEKQIRYFYSVFFWEKYGAKVVVNEHPNFNEVSQIVHKLAKKTDITLSIITENKLSLYLLINLERISNGYILEKYTPPMKIEKNVLNSIEELLNELPFNIPKQELHYIGFCFTNRFLKPNLQSTHLSKELVLISQQIDLFLTRFSEKNEFILPNKPELQQIIFHHIVFKREFQGQNYFLVNRTKNTLQHIDKMYHSFITLAITELEDWGSDEWFTRENEDISEFLYLLIIHWKGLTNQIIELQTKISVLIISQFGETHELFLAEILKSFFPNELMCYSLAEEKFGNEKIQLVVTDAQVEEVRKKIAKEIPIIGIEYAPNERNWENIKKILSDIKQVKENGDNWLNAYSHFN